MTTCSGRCQLGYGRFVLVADWTRSGKSTLAAALAAELGPPLLPRRDQGSSHGRPGPTGDGAGQRPVRLRAAAGAHVSRPARQGAQHRPAGPGEDSVSVPHRPPSCRPLRRRRTDQGLCSEPSHPMGLGPVVMADGSRQPDIAELAATVAQVLATT